MNRDDAVTAVLGIALPVTNELMYGDQEPEVAADVIAWAAVAALEPYIAARIAAETEALRRDVERLTEARDSAWQHYDEQVADNADLTAERDEARAALARVEALCDEFDARELDPWYWSDATGPIRRAITGEA